MFRNRKIRHKFNAVRTKNDRGTFHSKLEERYDRHLQLLMKAGEVLFYLSQIPLRLPGGTKYIVDFLVFYADGSVKFLDVKGIETNLFRLKKREIEAIYPIEIEIVKKGDF